MAIRFFTLLLCATLCMGATPRHSHDARHDARQPLTVEAIDQAQFAQGQNAHGQNSNPALIVKAEVLLDRFGFSPSVIDGRGSIRLTNWDALDLAAMVHRGTVVDFVG
jgi:hypothetical protein